MSDTNFTPPQADLIAGLPADNITASRWKRLQASMVDSLTIAVVTLTVMYLTGGFSGISRGVRPSAAYSLMVTLVGVAAFLLINGKLLLASGKTIGKRMVGIKIVDLNGNLPTVRGHLLKRYAVYFLPGQIPFIGQLLSLVNVLWIFGQEKRCLHDLVAGTKVVEG